MDWRDLICPVRTEIIVPVIIAFGALYFQVGNNVYRIYINQRLCLTMRMHRCINTAGRLNRVVWNNNIAPLKKESGYGNNKKE
jgi:hypothetical protein